MIIPGILEEMPDRAERLLDQLAHLNPEPSVLHIDIIDGEFAPNLTIDSQHLQEMNLPNLPIDIHLMTMHPSNWVHELRGVENIRTIIGQVERMESQEDFFEEVEANHFQVGFSLDLYTPFSALEEQWLPSVSMVQIMGGKAGEKGQEFKPQVLEKIREAVQYRQENQLNYRICIDIGMNPTTIPTVLEAGADDFVVVSFLQGGNQQQNWERLREIVGEEE